MKTLKTLAAIAVFAVSTSANAWFGNDGWGNNWNPYDEWDPRYWMEEMEDIFDDNDGPYGYGTYGYGAPYGYAPYGYAPAPAMTEEQQAQAKAQQEAFQKAQQEAFAQQQEAMKNFQQPAFAAPATVSVSSFSLVSFFDSASSVSPPFNRSCIASNSSACLFASSFSASSCSS